MATRSKTPGRAPARRVTKQPLRCYACGNTRVKVTAAQQRLKGWDRRAGRTVQRVHVSVECPKCGNEFWSRHPEAIRKSHELDATRREQASDANR